MLNLAEVGGEDAPRAASVPAVPGPPLQSGAKNKRFLGCASHGRRQSFEVRGANVKPVST